MKNKWLTTILMVICVSLNTYAQANFFDLLNKPMYDARVKLVDEFFARFNGIEKRKGVSEEYSDRKSNILMLFNFAQFKSQKDTLFMAADTFAQEIVRSGSFINFSDSNWYAKARCSGSLAKKKVNFILYLTVEKRGKDMYKWVIADAEGDIFKTSRDIRHQELFIFPNDNEQSFLSLANITHETYDYIDDYAKKDYKADALSAFLTLVRSGFLKIDYVSDVEFVFMQIPNYVFTVKHFERESMNVGWLINSFKKCVDSEKEEILANLHHSPRSALKQCENQISVLKDSLFQFQNVIFTQKNRLSVLNDSITALCNDSRTDMSLSEKVVRRFGYNLKMWFETKDNGYYKKAIGECSKKGKDCYIDDILMDPFLTNIGSSSSKKITIDNFLKEVKTLMEKDELEIKVFGIKQTGEDENAFYVLCNIDIVGAQAYSSKVVFSIDKIGEYKIKKISSYN